MLKLIPPAFAVAMLAACQPAPQAKTDGGVPSPYDGQWQGRALSSFPGCGGITVRGGIQNARLIGVIRQHGRQVGRVSGEVSETGLLEGVELVTGDTGGDATIQFEERTATGTWTSNRCGGEIQMTRG